MNRVLVTGAAGFAGGHLIEELIARDLATVGTYYRTPPPEHLLSSGCEWRPCDVREADAVHALVASARPDAVVHLAAMSLPGQANAEPRAAFDTNVGGWLSVLEAVRRTGRRCRLLLVSSSHVYGHQPPGPDGFTEDLAPAPHDVYATTRTSAEILAHVYHGQHGLDIVIARPFNHCGPRQRADFFVASLARQVARILLGHCPPELRLGDLEVIRDFTDVRDVAAAYVALLKHGQAGEVYNVCSGRPVSLQAVVDMLAPSVGGRIRTRTDPALQRGGEAQTVFGSHRKLREATGWQPRFSLHRALHDALEFWKEQVREAAACCVS